MNLMVRLLSFLWLPTILAGCGAAPFEYYSYAEIPEGPGMLTRDEGVLAIYSNHDAKEGVVESEQRSGSSSDNKTMDLREFKEFLRFKKSQRDSPEYRQFRERQEWKKFRAWKEHTPRNRPAVSSDDVGR